MESLSKCRLFVNCAGLVGTLALAALACSSKADAPHLNSSPPDGLEWGEGGPSFTTDILEAEPYTGNSVPVLEAQSRLPTGSAFHSEVILRSCGPLGGVCHNRKEYPDLRSPANFLATIGAPCNVQSGTPEGVFDRCERTGDRISFDGRRGDYEIGWMEVIPGEFNENDTPEEMAGLHLHLGDAVDRDSFSGGWGNLQFSRVFVTDGEVERLGYATYSGSFHLFDDGHHIVAEIPDYRVNAVNELIQSGVEQGDMNRNGIFGARPDADGKRHGPVALIEPGQPEKSYIAARLRGHMQGENVPGTRMPLANPPFSVAEMLAFFCFIEGIPESGEVNLASQIDYKNCSYAEPDTHGALAIEGAGRNWADRVSPLLEANCGGCHSEERAEGELVLVGEGVYDTLLESGSSVDPEGRTFIVPGDPRASYLYLKLLGDESITGRGMPMDILAGARMLADDELADIEAWIVDGAAP